MNPYEVVSKVMDVLPQAMFGTDNEGQVIIYTNLHEVWDRYGEQIKWVPFDEPNLTGV